jgi:hypothetical protein
MKMHKYKVLFSFPEWCEFKMALIRLCYEGAVPVGILHRLVDNLRYVKGMMLEGSSVTDYI